MTGYDRDNTNLNYEDIINLPHPVSKRHKPMPVEDRAAQFAPFAALTGHQAAIESKGCCCRQPQPHVCV